MCGIAGILNFSGSRVSDSLLKKMTDSMHHRGPDDEGFWIDGPIGLGHRRLSIIDLSPKGHQPMISENKRYIISYNGEIYNFLEIRNELEKLGKIFKSNSDTEVVLEAFSEWGVDVLKKFNGMFSFAIWDRNNQSLLLARDRYGIKPLYIAEYNGILSFASEQKAILVDPYFTKELNIQGLSEYLTFQNFFTSNTLLKKISTFPAGHYAMISLKSKNPILNYQKYWDYNFKNPEEKFDRREYIEELDRLFNQAVNRQTVSDVEIGGYLSGGIDSSSIAAISTKFIPEFKTFTCGFDLKSASGIELSFDERDQARKISNLFNTNHHEIILKSGDMSKAIPDISFHLEEPRVGQSYPNYYIAKLASKFVKVVFSGAGGDELFGGYPWRYYRFSNSLSFDDYLDNYFNFWQRLTNDHERKGIFSNSNICLKDLEGFDAKKIFKSVFNQNESTIKSPEDFINQSLYFESKTFLHGLFLVEDKLSMAHSLETRVPFMDNDLVDFAMKCPVSLKLNKLEYNSKIDENDNINKSEKYFQKTSDGKQILRDAMKKYLPPVVTSAIKKGFSSPDASWFKGESIEFVRYKLLNDKSPLYQYLDYNFTSGLINEHLLGKKNRRLLIWSLLNLDAWLEQNFFK